MKYESESIDVILDKNDVVIILGDKGTGKTTEIQQFQSEHQNNSIYFELKDIYSVDKNVKSKIESFFKSRDLKNDVSYLYLLFDSIDECRLQSVSRQDAFEIALQKIRSDIESQLFHTAKLKFIFTSRETDWKKDMDANLIQKYLRDNMSNQDNAAIVSDSKISKDTADTEPASTKQHPLKLKVYILEELNKNQKRLIAKHFDRSEDFFEKDIIAQGYSNTPLDCLEFLRFKTRHKNAAYKVEDFLRYKLQYRYRELNGNRNDNQLPITKIEHLLKRLAAATLFCKTRSIQKNESYSTVFKSNTNDILLFELFPEEDSSCLNNFISSTLFLSNGENSVKFWDELSKDNIAYSWLKDRIENGKYNEVKNLIFQKCNNIVSPKNSFAIPAVFLANTEPEFRRDLIEFHPELLVLYSYYCESLTEFDKKEILNNLLNKYPYRIPNIVFGFSNNEIAFSFFVKGFDIEYIINKLQEIKRKDSEREYFFIQLLYYSDVKNLDGKLKEKVSSLMFEYLFSKKDNGIRIYPVEILLKQEDPKINQKLKIFLDKNKSKLSELTIETLLKYLYPQYISFKETTILMKSLDVEKMVYLKNIYTELIQKLSDVAEIKSILNSILFDFSKENEMSIYITLLIRLIDCAGEPDKISSYLLRLHKHIYNDNVNLDSNYKNKEELAHLKEKITPYLNTDPKHRIWKNFLNLTSYPSDVTIKNETDDLKTQKEKEKKRQFLNKHIKGIRNATKQCQKILVCLSFENRKNGLAGISYIENEWGAYIANAYREGIKKYWQICKLDFNKYVGTNEKFAVLTGLHLFFQDNPDVCLNEEQAKRAIYLGIQESNFLPDWAIKCIKIYPKTAKEIILPIIDETIKSNTDNYLLFKLSQIDGDVLNIFYEDLWERIQSQRDSKSIRDVVKIIANMNLKDIECSKLAEYICDKIPDIESPDTTSWLELLYSTDKKIADKKIFVEKIRKLEKKYSKNLEKMKQFFIDFFDELYFRQMCEIKNKTADDKELVDLLPLLFKYIAPNNDTQHKNGEFFYPGARYNAESFRNQIFNLISVNNFTKDDRDRLLDIAKNIKDKQVSDKIQCVADELLLIDEGVLTENDVIKIENSDYLPPKSADDLFEIVCNKLEEIKTDIETSDYSLKKLCQDLAASESKNEIKIEKEEHFQKYMLMELRRLSRNLYSSVREPEVADDKKPDLQIWDRNWCVNIECKVADNWSGKNIRDAIESQLIEKYLKYPKYRHGILLLSRIKRENWEIDGPEVCFSKLIGLLQLYADEVKKKYNHIKDIRIIGIDYFIKQK
jgi:hypothetical protein